MICHSSTSARIRATIIGVAAAIASGLGPIPASGQDSGGIVIDADDCVDLASADARLACYDRRADAARQARERAATPQDAGDASASAEPEPPVASGADPGETEAAATRQSRSRSGSERGTPDDGAVAERASASSNRADARSDESDARSENGEDRDQLVTTIAGLRETVPDAYLITLENGQVWRQVQPKRYWLRPGDEVRIYVSRWGSYRLESDGPGTFIEVERVR